MSKHGFTILVAGLVMLLNAGFVYSSAEIMTDIAKGFGQALDDCKKELNIGDHILTDMYNFWKEDYTSVNRDLGCLINCMSNKHNLVGTDGKLHHDNAEEFAKKHGADETTAKQLVSMLHECEKANDGNADTCMRVLDIAKCFKTKTHELKWAPNIQEVIGEVMADQAR